MRIAELIRSMDGAGVVIVISVGLVAIAVVWMTVVLLHRNRKK